MPSIGMQGLDRLKEASLKNQRSDVELDRCLADSDPYRKSSSAEG